MCVCVWERQREAEKKTRVKACLCCWNACNSCRWRGANCIFFSQCFQSSGILDVWYVLAWQTLERKEYFGQYGKILKISVSKLNGQNSQHSSASPSASVWAFYSYHCAIVMPLIYSYHNFQDYAYWCRYVTYMKEEDALRCIQAVNGFVLEGKVLKYVLLCMVN